MEKKAKRSRGSLICLIIVVLLAAIIAATGYITDFLWFKELGYVSVFFKKLVTQLELGIPVFIVVGFLTYIYLKLLKKGYYNKVESDDNPDSKTVNLFSWLMAALFAGVAVYFTVTQLWYKWLNMSNSTDFGVTDPLFDNDVSLYVFKLPFINQVTGIVMALAVAFIIVTLIYYIILMSLRRPKVFDEPEVEFTESYAGPDDEPVGGRRFGKFGAKFAGRRPSGPRREFDSDNLKQLLHIASKQLIVVGVIFFLMLGFHFFLKQYDLLYAHRGAVYGAGFTAVNITLWVYRALMGLSVIAALMFIYGVAKKNFKKIVVVPIIMIAVFAVGTGVEVIVQNYIVSPDELEKETAYLEYNIEYTQKAYGLENVETKKFAASSSLDGEDIANNPETISNIRINDYSPTKKLYNQTQSIRQYYDFNDVDVDRYMIDGEYTQTFLSAREINEEAISSTFVNTHLKYTHGYGIALSRVDKVTSSGQADVLVGNIPPESDTESINVTNPAVYFGELTNDWILVNTDEKEFDYPDGDSNQ